MTGAKQDTDRYLGTVLAGAYRLDAFLGAGAQGAVFRATELATERPFALKLFHTTATGRLEREAHSLLRLDVPGVVPVHAYGTSGGRAYLVTELLDGESLEAVLRREGAKSLGLEATLRYVAPLAATLDAAHDRGLVHRDLRPSNVFVERSGNVRLLDFGYARIADHTPITSVDLVPGSVAYIAPEALTSEELDGRADLYALGVLAFRCLTGHEPFEGGSPVDRLTRTAHAPRPSAHALAPTLPKELDAFFARALAIAPERRFVRGEALAAALAYCRALGPVD